ncbi:MAG: OmpA family protein, partial [Gammaproteobacteria bacterium]
AGLAAELQAARVIETGITGRLAKAQDFARTASAELVELRKKITAGEQRQTKLKELVQNITDERSAARANLARQNKQVAALTAELQNTAATLSKVQQETTAAQQSCGEAESRYQACQEQLARRNTTLEREVRDRTRALTDAVSVRGKLQGELTACTEEIARLRVDCDNAKQATSATIDDDADGVTDDADLCPGTQAGVEVGPAGCARNAPVALEGVSFLYDSHELTSESHAILDRVAAILRQHPELRLEVAGHTDTQGDPDYNLWLSQARASAVQEYLKEQGVNTASLTARGYGSQQPIADNTTRAGLARNRRVELRRLP